MSQPRPLHSARHILTYAQTLRGGGVERAMLRMAAGWLGEGRRVTLVLGSPMSTCTFGDQTAWYYVETKVNQTSFGLAMVQERTVLAVYFDKNKKVVDKAVYSLKDGKPVTIESRRTPSYGEDRTFVEQILGSVGL